MAQTQFSIEKLKATVGEFAKGNRYNVSITPPAFLSASSQTLNKLPFLCESVSLPTKGIATNPHDIGNGPPREIAYRETFTESALSFILDDAFEIKSFFDGWQAGIMNSNSTRNPNYYFNYVGEIRIARLINSATTLDPAAGNYRVVLLEAYPSAVGEVALGHAQGNEVLKLSVTFKYRRWNALANFL
tara:strand:- start:175 stop:738 length:564 start_codon:yes stop_codon:yes gene_type:complete